ncbi:MAG TPA: branched-chain amino acid ABC transporter permease [Roseiflexaceae bacterium]|nr:branched-chain amino acid ABC transporter permease [Roseiflexaceae bacterium]
MNTSLLLQQVLNGLAIGSLYSIFALGYTLIFSILRVINFTHGAIFALGAYVTYLLTGSAVNQSGVLASVFTSVFGKPALPLALPFLPALLLGAVIAGLAAMLVERAAFRPLRVRAADPLLALVSSLGVAIVIVNIIQYLVGTEIYPFPDNLFGALPRAINFGVPGRPIPIRTVQIIMFVVSMLIVILLTYLINGTRTGKALRAVAEDLTTSQLLGIDPDRLILLTFFLSGFLGGIAGTLVGLSVGINGPYFGIAYGLKGLAVMVLGGLGDIPGAVVGGLVIGMAESFVPPEYNAYKDAVAFALLFVVLLARPQGLLGRVAVQKV